MLEFAGARDLEPIDCAIEYREAVARLQTRAEENAIDVWVLSQRARERAPCAMVARMNGIGGSAEPKATILAQVNNSQES